VITLAVCDPLARETASECVRKRARREYALLVMQLRDRADVDIMVVYCPTDNALLAAVKSGEINAVLAKAWTVLEAGSAACAPFERLADLADANGSTDLTGAFIVRADSPIASVAELDGKTVLMGPDGAYEKSFAARRALAEAGAKPASVQVLDACIPVAAAVLERSAEAGIVSGYVVDYGGLDLAGGAGRFKTLARTKPVPFMTFAVSTRTDPAVRERIRAALLEITGQNVPDDLYSTGFTEPAPWQPEERKP